MMREQGLSLILEHLEVLREVFDLTNHQSSLDRIAGELNKRGVNTWGQGRREGSILTHMLSPQDLANSRAPIRVLHTKQDDTRRGYKKPITM